MTSKTSPRKHNDYSVGWICATEPELVAARAMLDEIHWTKLAKIAGDENNYLYGQIGQHNIVIASLPSGSYGVGAASTVAKDMRRTFPNLNIRMMVGVGGGVPVPHGKGAIDIRLGDIIISDPNSTSPGVIQYDLGKIVEGQRWPRRTGSLDKPPAEIRAVVSALKAKHKFEAAPIASTLADAVARHPVLGPGFIYQGAERDVLFEPKYQHNGQSDTCEQCDKSRTINDRPPRSSTHPRIHYGTIGSGDLVVKDSVTRDYWYKTENIICFDTQAAGLDSFHGLVIRGVCDYADSHSHKEWQEYAALAAAAYAKDLVLELPPPAPSASKVRSTTVKFQQWRLAYSNPADGKTTAVNIYDLGLDLGDAPIIDQENFVGRERDLEILRKTLVSDPEDFDQKIAIISALGGMGKTQLAVAFAKRYNAMFSAIFWVNAATEIVLRRRFAAIAARLSLNSSSNSGQDEEDSVEKVRDWLSRPDNSRWLLIFDNYDTPIRQGRGSSSGYNIRCYFPHRSQGCILVTTRCAELSFGKTVRLQKFEAAQAIDALTRRSGRLGAANDLDALELVKRFDGLPLALATAGDYLRHTPDSFAEYLRKYNESWQELEAVAQESLDYEGRTLYSLWNLSLSRIQIDCPEAVVLLKLLAYFSNHDIWFELLQHAATPVSKKTFNKRQLLAKTKTGQRRKSSQEQQIQPDFSFLQSKIKFGAIVRRLQSFSLLEASESTGGYSLHACVHDWTLNSLNRTMDSDLYWLAVHSVAEAFVWETRSNSWLENRRLLPHAIHLRFGHFQTASDIRQDTTRAGYFHCFGALYSGQGRFGEAEKMYIRALEGFEEALGPKHTSTLDTVNNLGIIYGKQGKLSEAEKMYIRALEGYEEALGLEHPSTLLTAKNLEKLRR